MKSYIVFTARILGIYAAILAFIHGIFEIQQGRIIVESININALGNGCVADQIWHACFPAITFWPTYFTAGLISMIISTLLFLFVLFFLKKSYAGWIMIAFAITNLLSGGGFIPTFTTIMAAVSILFNREQKQTSRKHQKSFVVIWSILLSVYMLYATWGWLFGKLINTFMVENSLLLFLVFNLCFPILSIVFARLADTHKTVKSS